MDTATTTPEWLGAFLPVLIILGLWSMAWKGVALYKAGSNKSVPWFVVLFLVNTLGILEIFYIFVFSRSKKKSSN
jgi:uncharacterized membrane protein YadS